MSNIAWIKDSEHRSFFVNGLNDQRKDGEFCDVHLKISGRTLPTHACVLSSCSPVFKELILADRPASPHLTGLPQEIDLVMPGLEGRADSPPIEDDGHGLEAMVDLLNYIYTGDITLKQDTLEIVIKLSEAFMLEGLTSLIKSHVSGGGGKLEATGSQHNKSSSSSPQPKRKRRRKMPPTKKVKVSSRTAAARTRLPKDPEARVLRSRERGQPTQESGDVPEEDDCSEGEEEADSEQVAMADEGSDAQEASSVVKPGYRYTCRHLQCDFQSDNARDIKAHKEVHPGRSYKCVSCDFYTGHCVKLLTHLREEEHAETECSVCGSVALDRAAFLEHLKRHDDRLKRFFCEICDYQCRTRSHLADHVAKHAIERPYVCDECNRGFKWKTSLQTHKLSHGKTKMHLCDQCGYSTAYRNNLRVHARKHNGGMLPCAYCDYQSNCKHQLKKHELTHSEPKLKPYVCEVCGGKFAHGHALRRHARVHDPEAHQLECNLCEFVTVRRDKLRDHVKKFHGGNLSEMPMNADVRDQHDHFVENAMLVAPHSETSTSTLQ